MVRWCSFGATLLPSAWAVTACTKTDSGGSRPSRPRCSLSKDEDELDENGPWRYCRSPLRAFDERRAALIIPSWLMTLDESMAAWTGVEGVEPGKGANFKPIPFAFLSVSASARSCRRARELWVWELGWGGREGSGTEAGSGREQGCRSE